MGELLPGQPAGLDDGFSAALSGARAVAGLTQEELADRSGLSVRAIRNLETGRTGRPRRQSVGLLANALGVPPTYLAPRPRSGMPGPGAALPSARSELPAECPDPVGRAALATDLCALLAGAPEAPRLVVVTGPPGCGKTAFVAHVAQELSRDFPDRQIYVDLDSQPGEPMTAAAVAARVLRSFGFEQSSPSPEEMTARARAALGSHRAIIVLDNVVSEAQVRPLICASARSVILVAARHTLAALPAARDVQLGALDEEAALTLLSRLAGPERVAAEPAGAASIVRSCEYLPLALHIAGLWLAARPHRPLSDLADRLADDHDRLDLLRVGDLSLHASVAAAVRRLTEPQRAALGKLRAVRGWFRLGDAAALLALPEPAAADLIDDLMQSQVVWGGSGNGGGARYRVHQSFRLYAVRALAAGPARRPALTLAR